jgi:dTMP kinase
MIINITGIDGCGKGTQLQYLADYLDSQGNKVFMSKAYGPSEKEMFSLFVEHSHDIAIMFLFQALHVQQRTRAEKALKDGAIVLADRWDESYLAYHSQYGILVHYPSLRYNLNTIAFNRIKPDITFLLKVPVEVSIERCILRGADFFDLKGHEYHQSLADQLDEMAKENSWIVLDGTRSSKKIHEEIVQVIESAIK